ncbi:MAG TPA: hypothetical protein P5137_11470, partial [Candidatus Brocadiia bacterium]|nr:hypothetical protein [Candidatus Brocadiia bacterium]
LFVWAATRGRKNERMLGLWFVAAFVPVLFLEHHSSAYLTLSFSAMALYVAVALARETEQEFLPLASAALGRRPKPQEWLPQSLRALLLAAAFGGMIWNARINIGNALGPIRQRASDGRLTQWALRSTVDALADSPARRACVLSEGPPSLAGLMLQRRHGFAVRRLRPQDGPVAVVSARFAPLPVYEDAVPLAQAAGRNLLPLAGFEQGHNPRFVGPGYRSGHSLLLNLQPGRAQLERWEVPCPRPGLYAFGACVRADADVKIRLSLVVEGANGSQTFPAWPRPLEDGWTQWVGCGWAPPGTPLLSVRLQGSVSARAPASAALADDVYLIPFAPPQR